nr:hypothetical protein [Tanacetum cinerariifolium]
ADLTRPDLGDFARHELAFLGAPCGDIQKLAARLTAALAPAGHRVGYVDADHASGDADEATTLSPLLQAGAAVEVTDKIHFRRRDERRAFDRFSQPDLLSGTDLVLAAPALAQVDSVRASTLPGRQVAEKAYNAGLASFNNHNYSAALTSFDQALAAKPDFAAAYANRAATRLALKEYPAAVSDYDQALKLEPSAYAAYFGRGQAREATGQLTEAETDYGAALKANPTYAPAWYNRGVLRFEHGEYQAAHDDFSGAVKADSTYAYAYH